jgi:hypothetical protein
MDHKYEYMRKVKAKDLVVGDVLLDGYITRIETMPNGKQLAITVRREVFGYYVSQGKLLGLNNEVWRQAR